MLLPKFKKTSLAIAEDGIALRTSNGALHLLSTSNPKLDVQSIVEALQTHQQLLKGQSVNLVLANVFVRLIVLPWQPGLYSRNDWDALANHAFREQYGAIADQWKVKVSLGNFGESVVATAVDQVLYEHLLSCAKQLDFKWQAIEPLAMHLLNQAKREYMATLIVEPQYLMLCEMLKSQFTRFSVMSPPAGQEAKHAVQMMERWQLQLPSNVQLSASSIHVSGKLKESLAAEELSLHERLNVTLVAPKQPYQTHASWLTTI